MENNLVCLEKEKTRIYSRFGNIVATFGLIPREKWGNEFKTVTSVFQTINFYLKIIFHRHVLDQIDFQSRLRYIKLVDDECYWFEEQLKRKGYEVCY